MLAWKTVIGTDDINPDSTTDGKANVANRGAGAFPAFDECENLVINGLTDWYLPAQDELDTLQTSRAAIDATALANGGDAFVTGTRYWSSTEANNDNAWYEGFFSGSQGTSPKTTGQWIRCVRRPT